MPNWCSNHMTVSGDAAKVTELAEKIVRPHPDKPTEMTFDFNGICPMPEDLLNVSSFCSEDEIHWGSLDESLTMPQIAGAISDGFYQKLKAELEKTFDWQKLTIGHVNRWLNNVCPDLQSSLGLNPDAARKTAYNIKHHGAPGWYDWRILHWGTKWNADCCYISRSDGLLEMKPHGLRRRACTEPSVPPILTWNWSANTSKTVCVSQVTTTTSVPICTTTLVQTMITANSPSNTSAMSTKTMMMKTSNPIR